MPDRRIPLLFQQALAAHKAGRFEEAGHGYQRILRIDPRHAASWHLRGLVCYQLGQLDQAETLIRRSLTLMDQANARYALGLVLAAQGRQAEAETAFRQALVMAPGHPDACNGLGLLLREQGRWTEAEVAFRTELASRPDQADPHYNLGLVLHESSRPEEAELAYRQALFLAPEHASAEHGLGRLLQAQRRFEAAETAYRRTLALKPEAADIWNDLATLLAETGRAREAETAYRQALSLWPAFAEAHNNLGNLLDREKRLTEAEQEYRRAAACEPGYGHPLGMIPHLRRKMAAWSGLAEDDAACLAFLRRRSPSDLPPFPLLAMPEASPLDQREAGRLYAEFRWPAALAAPPLVATGATPVPARLRIGYLSADFRDHPVSHLLVGVLEARRRETIAVHLYAYGRCAEDTMRQRLRMACDGFHDIAGISDRAAAHRIAEDGIDILVDLAGYTSESRQGITALRPAPIIANWLGYPATLGHPRLADYLIGDPVITPLAHAGHFSEALALLPHCYQPNDIRRTIAATPDRATAGLPESGFVFCSFNQIFKLDETFFTLWCRLLRTVPDSLLWLSDPGDASIAANLRREARGHGIDPGRLVFAPRVETQAEHLGRLRLADLALDTFPYTSHTTGSDALWAGVPIVTRLGDTLAGRVAASLLYAAGLPELVAPSDEAYFALARDLAGNPARLAGIRSALANRRADAPLFDTAGFARDLERLYRGMWSQHTRGIRAGFTLTPDG